MFLSKKSRNLTRRPMERPIKVAQPLVKKTEEAIIRKPIKRAKPKKEIETVEAVEQINNSEE